MQIIPHWNQNTVMPPGHWRMVNRVTDKPGTPVDVLKMSCPLCGVEGDLTEHSVGKDGAVTPSVDCPECDFHDHVRLDEPEPPYDPV